jgi:hypothetical protein
MYGQRARHTEYDLGLSAFEKTRLAVELPDAIRQICAGDLERGFVYDISGEASKRAGLGAPSPRSIVIPTGAQLFQGSRLDQIKLMQRAGMVVGTPAQGGFLVETENLGFIDLLRNRSVVLHGRRRRENPGGLLGRLEHYLICVSPLAVEPALA